MNRRVSVWKYVRIGKKWRYCKPAVGKNGKIKPDRVIVQGRAPSRRQLLPSSLRRQQRNLEKGRSQCSRGSQRCRFRIHVSDCKGEGHSG